MNGASDGLYLLHLSLHGLLRGASPELGRDPDTGGQITYVLELVRARPFDLGNGVEIHKTCSLGFCAYPMAPKHPEALTWQRVVEVADRCLYAAKLSGRDGWVGIHGECVDVDSVLTFLDAPDTACPDHCTVLTSFPDVTRLHWREQA